MGDFYRSLLFSMLVVSSCSIALSIGGCGQNLFKGLVEAETDEQRLAEAENLIDEKNYSGALAQLQKVDSDSNQKRLLQAAAQLGVAGLSVFDIIIGIIDGEQLSGNITFDQIFQYASASLFGSGETKSTRLEAMRESISMLLQAPQPDERRINNLNCFLGGLLTFVAIEDGNTALSQVSSSLATINSNAVGSGATAAECPGVEELDSGLSQIATVQNSLSIVFAATANCSFINTEAGDLNQVESQLSSFQTVGDQGCVETPDCGDSAACQALSLGCVGEKIDTTDAVAGDGVVSSCELVQNCIGSSCFGN